MPTVEVSKVAAFLNLDERRVQQLVKEGMPRESRGQYDPVKCAHFYIRFSQLRSRPEDCELSPVR
jgi:phage terminase Nu1 subunit (DNA packaging protein)